MPEPSPARGDSQENHYLPNVGQHPLPPPPPPACTAPGCRLTDQRMQAKKGIHYFSSMSDIFKLFKKKKKEEDHYCSLKKKTKEKREESTLWSKPYELAPSFSQLLLVGAALRSHLLQDGMGEILPAPVRFKGPSLTRAPSELRCPLLTRTRGACLLLRAGLICRARGPRCALCKFMALNQIGNKCLLSDRPGVLAGHVSPVPRRCWCCRNQEVPQKYRDAEHSWKKWEIGTQLLRLGA